MKRTRSTLLPWFCLILSVACVLPCRSQETVSNTTLTLENPGGGKVIYSQAASQVSLTDGLAVMLRLVESRLGGRPLVGNLLRSRDGNTLAVFFTTHARNDQYKPMAGLMIVTAKPGVTPQSAVLFDKADRFPFTEAQLLHLLATDGPISESPSLESAALPPAGASPRPAEISPLHLASGGDKSASICLPPDWSIVQVSGGSLTAKGPNNEVIALNSSQMVIDPDSPTAHQLARMPKFSNLPQSRFPSEEGLFSTFTDVLNQLRATRKLPPAKFTLISSRNLDATRAKVRPLEATYDLDLADGVGTRKGSARIDVVRTGSSPEWLMSISTSSIPLAYAAAEERTMRTVIRSFRQNEDVIMREMEDVRGQIGDPIPRDHDHGGYMPGEKAQPESCATLSKPEIDTARWPGSVSESFILDPAAGDAHGADSASDLSDWLVRSHPDVFELTQLNQQVQNLDY